MARTNYIFVDHENVQPTVPAALRTLDVRLVIFVGSNQSKLNTDLVIGVQELGSKAEYVKIEGNGPNALDFHIAFHIGRISAVDPNAFFHIVSKDSGFDPLIAYLKAKRIPTLRHMSIEDIPIVEANSKTNQNDCVKTVIGKLSERKSAPPKTRTTLKNAVKTMFGGQMSEDKLDSILNSLEKQKVIEVIDGKVVYHLPAAKALE